MAIEKIRLLDGMEGMLLSHMRARSRRGRWGGEFRVQWDGGAWLLLWLPPGADRAGWEKGGVYLMAETSGKPRRFARADTVLRIVERELVVSSVMVHFAQPELGLMLNERESFSEVNDGESS